MKIKGLFITGTAVLMLSMLLGCGGNNSNPLGGNCNGLTWAEIGNEQGENLVEASNELSNNPSVQSCEAYRGALQDYYNALSDLSSNCLIGVSEAQYEDALAEAQESINEIDCSEYESN